MIKERINHGCSTLLEAIKMVETEGYSIPFAIRNNRLLNETDHTKYGQENVASIFFLRIDAPFSEPDEQSILYLIALKNGKKGWISDSYSIYADTTLNDFLHDFETRKSSEQ